MRCDLGRSIHGHSVCEIILPRGPHADAARVALETRDRGEENAGVAKAGALPRSDSSARSAQQTSPVDRIDLGSDQPLIDLGDSQQRMRVSMESFFEFNFDISEDLEDFLEEKLMDSYQSQWAAEFDPPAHEHPQFAGNIERDVDAEPDDLAVRREFLNREFLKRHPK